ncbi:hypothetical protein E4U13_000825 [Claviceps humidiphila]|uniref:Uncharacterized protein n=1 Tax=Claviceps humidiphila TaxID=1294629 RepID=A0A9P7Q3Q9_9HYPO|nr:hypothetical protein E4U13_000825 [Claviceps humidiphila]
MSRAMLVKRTSMESRAQNTTRITDRALAFSNSDVNSGPGRVVASTSVNDPVSRYARSTDGQQYHSAQRRKVDMDALESPWSKED